MTDSYENALEILTDVLEPRFPDAAAFLKAPKGADALGWRMQVNTDFGCGAYDHVYHGAVEALWGDESDIGEAGDFLNSRIVRNAYYDRVREEIRKADLEIEQAERDETERRKCLKEKLDRLTSDGILTNEERKELDRSPFLDGGNDDLPW